MPKKWIQNIGMKKGALHSALGVPMANKIPSAKLKLALKKKGRVGKMASLAKTLMSFKGAK